MKNNTTTPVSKEVLYEMLTYKRPYGGQGVIDFTAEFLTDIEGADCIFHDELGNVLVSVGFNISYDEDVDMWSASGAVSKVMFSAHIDSVHREDGRQTVVSDSSTGVEIVSLGSKRDTHCLGSDDAAGCWVLLNLIKARVAGLYVFHNGEEVGGIGSGHLSKMYPEFFEQFNYCIAIDRKGEHDIIIDQAGGDCCSVLFAQTLADALGMGHKPDNTGIYTDSAEYTHLIAECTNISAGYYSEHTLNERVNVTYLQMLVQSMLTVDFESLPVARDKYSSVNHWRDYYADESYYDDVAYANTDYKPRDEAELHYGKNYVYYEDMVFQDPYAAAELLYLLCK